MSSSSTMYLRIRELARQLMASKNLEKNLLFLMTEDIPSEFLVKLMIRDFVKELEVPEELKDLRVSVIDKLRPSSKRPIQHSAFEPVAKRSCAPLETAAPPRSPVFDAKSFRIPKKEATPPFTAPAAVIVGPTELNPSDRIPKKTSKPVPAPTPAINTAPAPMSTTVTWNPSVTAAHPMFPMVSADENVPPMSMPPATQPNSLLSRLISGGFLI